MDCSPTADLHGLLIGWGLILQRDLEDQYIGVLFLALFARRHVQVACGDEHQLVADDRAGCRGGEVGVVLLQDFYPLDRSEISVQEQLGDPGHLLFALAPALHGDQSAVAEVQPVGVAEPLALRRRQLYKLLSPEFVAVNGVIGGEEEEPEGEMDEDKSE